MTYEITTPSGYTLIADEEENYYLELLKEKGYQVRRVPPNVCISCES
jgi:hypothetical protein